MVTEDDVWAALAEIPDPEIPVISLVDLGVIKEVVADDGVRIDFTPTFMGCPALETMEREMRARVAQLGAKVEVRVVLDDSWSPIASRRKGASSCAARASPRRPHG